MNELENQIASQIKNKTQRQSLGAAMRRGRDGRTAALSTLKDPEEFRRNTRKIKEQAITKIDQLVDEFSLNAAKTGARVFLATDGTSAIKYIAEVAKANNAKLIVKSKSQTTEEIELNHPLEKLGYQVVETDLGERIIQLAQEKPIHLVFPASHKTVEQVSNIFSKESGINIRPQYDAIMEYVRGSLRSSFLAADIGVTGANIAIAETGTLVIETNEGNARLVTSLPRVHIALVGIEKIVPTIEDALQMIQAHPISASGQKLTTYVSFISGRSPLKGEGSLRQLHIVILDNGRSKMQQDEDFREALYCIRCGACMNICPTYEVAGGHVFGYIYPGPIGIPWTANVHGFDKSQYAQLCIACGLCREMCPADIDIPYLIARVKQLNKEERGQSHVNKIVMRSDELAKIASAAAPFSNWILRRSSFRYLMEKLTGLDRNRQLPTFSRNSFYDWWKKHKSVTTSTRNVAYFVDVYANYNRPDIGVATIELLEKAGVRVVVPDQKPSGMPYFSYGELDKVRSIAKFNVDRMLPLVKEGFEVVATEPTATYCFKEIYTRLLNTEDSRLVANHTHELLDYLRTEGLTPEISCVYSAKAGLHISCHQRAMSMAQSTINLMSAIGLKVTVIETGTCCGMGGTFGLKTGALGYELSREVGEPLFDLFKNANVNFGLSESSVCMMQLEQGTGLPFEHPVAILAAAARGDTEYPQRTHLVTVG